MTEHPSELRALAFVVAKLAKDSRKAWPEQDVLRALIDDHRTFAEVVFAAANAATNADTKYPAGIRTTPAGTATRPETNTNRAYSTIERCRKCGALANPGHVCEPSPMPDAARAFIAANQALTDEARPWKLRLEHDPDDTEARKVLTGISQRRRLLPFPEQAT